MFLENIQLAFSSLRSNKMRALLTMLGIIIGIMSIITIMIIGDAVTASVAGELSALGGDSIMISVAERTDEPMDEFGPGGGGGNPFNQNISGRTPLSEDLISEIMIEEMRAAFLGDIVGVSLSHSRGAAEVRDLERHADVNVNGVNADFFLANSVELIEGRLISAADLAEGGMVAVVSDRLVERMFGGLPVQQAIGRQLHLFSPTQIEVFTVIGVYRFEESGFMGMGGGNDNAPTTFYIPLTTAQHGTIERNHSNITVLGAAGLDVHELTAALQGHFDGVYAANEFWQANVMNMASILDTIEATLGTISLAIMFIAGISLVVGGIGVMNIMLVSVTERTREIGTRKALGAKNFHIQLQFVVEALIISLVGGVIGMALGVLIGGAVATVFGVPLVVSPVVVIGSMLFSMVIGVFFGLYPASRAAKLDPIEALRYE